MADNPKPQKNVAAELTLASGIVGIGLFLVFTALGRSFAPFFVGYFFLAVALVLGGYLIVAALKTMPSWQWQQKLGAVMMLLGALPVALFSDNWTVQNCSQFADMWLFGPYGLICPFQQMGWALLTGVGVWLFGWMLFFVNPISTSKKR